MTQKKNIQVLIIVALVFISLGGWLLHLRIHPPFEEGHNLIPFIAGLASVLIIPLMFLFSGLVQYAYVLNGFIVIIGTITMAHFGLAHIQGPVTIESLVFRTPFPDIVMLFTKFFIGKALFDLNRMVSTEAPHSGLFFRYPNMGWWYVHFVAVSVVYAAGHFLWK